MTRPATPLLRALLGLLLAFSPLSGCQGGGLFGLGTAYVSSDLPASIFYLDAPASAVANQPFVVKAWVVLDRNASGWQEVKAESFQATVVPTVNQITVGGQVRLMKLASATSTSGSDAKPTAEAVPVTVTAGAGTYVLTMANFPDKVPTDLFFAGYPWSAGGVQVKDVPRPQPGRSIVIEPAPAVTRRNPGTVTVSQGASAAQRP